MPRILIVKFVLSISHCTIYYCVPQCYSPNKTHNEHLPVNRKDLPISDYLWKSDYSKVLPEQSHLNVRDKATTQTMEIVQSDGPFSHRMAP